MPVLGRRSTAAIPARHWFGHCRRCLSWSVAVFVRLWSSQRLVWPRQGSILVRSGTLLALVSLLGILVARAEVIQWTNTSGGWWSGAANWSPNQVPSTHDVAVITNAGTYTVSLLGPVGVAGLEVGGDSGTQTLNTAEQVLEVHGNSSVGPHGILQLANGALGGTGRVNLAGLLLWDGGTIDTNISMTVSAGGRIQIGPGANYSRVLHGAITNGGNIVWTNSGWLFIGGVLHNLKGGVFDAQWTAPIVRYGSNAVFINEGVFRKSGGAGNLECQVPLVISGTVDTQTGALLLGGGSRLNAGSIFSGAGATWLYAGTHTLSGGITSANLGMLGDLDALLTGNGSLSGLFTWAGGTIGTNAVLMIAPTGRLLIKSSGNFNKVLFGHLSNAGTISWQPLGWLFLGGTLWNQGLFEAQANSRIAALNNGEQIVNLGIFRLTTAGATVCDVPFVNYGSVEVGAGTLGFERDFMQAAGSLSLAGGTIKMTQSPPRPLHVAGGRLTGWGTVQAEVTNAACVRPSSSNGVLTISGSFAQSLGGMLELELAGNLPGTNQSRLNITGLAKLGGTVAIRWQEGYLPDSGTLFPVLNFASRQGEFCCFDHCVLLGQGRRLEPLYAATSLTLATVAAPEPPAVPLRVTVDGGALICWPAEFTGYALYWSSNLAQPNWTRLSGVTNRWLEAPPLAREKFFRLQSP
jgi:hypothetical protein